MSEEVARCPHCGSIKGGTAAALDALYGEVARLSRLAEGPVVKEAALAEAALAEAALAEAALAEAALAEAAVKEAAAREADLLREIRLLRETVARLRGGIVTLRRLDILFSRPTMNRHFPKGAGVA